MEYTARELYDLLNDSDECSFIEAKTASTSSRSVMETICSFSNEPAAGGGYLILGVAPGDDPDVQRYYVSGITDTDKMQQDIASQCNTIFNVPIRVEMNVEKLADKNVIVVFVPELSHKQKPLYFKKDGFPKGAYRRIGSSDEICKDVDIPLFYSDERTYEQTVIEGSSVESDVDENAIERYKTLRGRINPAAEELAYSNVDLLEALLCVNPKHKSELNLTGLLLFGTSKAQRRYIPMFRADYIRIPGNSWVESPEARFQTIDMRGPILLLIYRLLEAVNADLPRGFVLPEGEIQAESVGLPIIALREAIVNSLMHCSYREQRPIQIRRFDNRIEIENSGYSLKRPEELGQPGSMPRNPALAQVLHDINLAETKGSGIRAMRRLMKAAHLAPPSFESSRSGNRFMAIMLLHNFLNPDDLKWLALFDTCELNDGQRMALVFIRELGAVDNTTYRQFGDCDTLHASADLRKLRDLGLIVPKGNGRSTYYMASEMLLNTYGGSAILQHTDLFSPLDSVESKEELTNANGLVTKSNDLFTNAYGLVNKGTGNLTNAYGLKTDNGVSSVSTQPKDYELLFSELPEPVKSELSTFKRREDDMNKIESIIMLLCSVRACRLSDLALLLKRKENTVSKYVKIMLGKGLLKYRYPEMIRHPEQAYQTITN